MAQRTAAGQSFTCALAQDGTVSCWGSNNRGQLGDGTNNNSATAGPVSGLSSIVGMSAGTFHACAVDGTGVGYCWGKGDLGEIGDGASVDRLTPMSPAVASISSISAGFDHTCAAQTSGAVYCWGDDNVGELGDGAAGSGVATPQVVPGVADAASVEVSFSLSCAVHMTGEVSCWGYNSNGQLGRGNVGGLSATPAKIAGLTGVSQLAAGERHVCALRSDGSVTCWGKNSDGQLGDGTQTDSGSPVDVSGISNAISVGAGQNHSCAFLADGTAVCWGANGDGQLGTGNTSPSLTPTPVVGL